jgi:hypothetical protein
MISSGFDSKEDWLPLLDNKNMLTPIQTKAIVMDNSDTNTIERTVIVHTGLSAEAYDSSPDQLARTEQIPAEAASQTYPNSPLESV